MAIVFWELLTREDPHKGMNAYQVIFAVGMKGLRPKLPLSRLSNCPEAFLELICNAWKEDPASRPSAEDVLSSLHSMPVVF